jgi:methyl-accepting chemotaxis protein
MDIRKTSTKEFDLVEERFLGDKSRVLEARQLFTDWKPIRDEVIAHMRKGERTQAAAITKEKGAAHVKRMTGATQYLVDFAFDKADQFIKNANKVRDRDMLITNVFIGISIVIATILAWLMTRSVVLPIRQALDVANAVAQGDLTSNVNVTGKDEIAQLLRSLSEMNGKLSGIVSEVRNGADNIGKASGEIAAGNSNLSQRTESQASSMEEMTSTVNQNADNTRQANQLVVGAREQAVEGGEVVGRAINAMSEINSSSKKIADIIGVIDEIAFQTNLLALNAAVEAARAGEQGRGFAVVAGEVRNLAQRSAEAAKEIKGLIQESVEKVEQGSALVNESGQKLEQIVSSVQKVTDIVSEIAAASSEQASGIEQVNTAITQMDDMTQQNAALVEEAAAASEAMEEQTAELSRQMEFFRLDSSEQRKAPMTVVADTQAEAAPAVERRGTGRPFQGKPAESAPTPQASTARTGTGDSEWEEF